MNKKGKEKNGRIRREEKKGKNRKTSNNIYKLGKKNIQREGKIIKEKKDK